MECPNCGEKVVKFPLKDKDGKWILKNFFKMDLVSILFFLTILAMVFGYQHDAAKCDDAIERPCEFCKSTGCLQAEKIREADAAQLKAMVPKGFPIVPIVS